MAQEKEALLIYVDDIESDETFIEMLSSLKEVSFIVLHLDSLKSLCQCAAPKTTYLFDALKAEWTNFSHSHLAFSESH